MSWLLVGRMGVGGMSDEGVRGGGRGGGDTVERTGGRADGRVYMTMLLRLNKGVDI